MSNAAKHRKKAAEFEQLKQIDRAIASYIKAVEESEREGADVDVALLNKVGDLTLRQGRVADAVTYYERAVEHYADVGLLNNAIALCNKILRSAPGRSNVYFTLGRICARKGLRGDATRNFLEYATRMQQEGRVDEGMRALAEVADLMPELTEVRRLVEEHADRAGVALPRRKTPVSTPAEPDPATPRFDNKSKELVFLDLGAGEGFTRRNTPPLSPRVPTPAKPILASSGKHRTPVRPASGTNKAVSLQTQSLDEFMLFDPNRPTPTEPLRPITPLESMAIASVDAEPIVTPAALESQELAPPVIEELAVPALAIEPQVPVSAEAFVEAVMDVSVESAELIIEPVVELVVEPVVEPLVEPLAELVVEPVVAEEAHDVSALQLDDIMSSAMEIDAPAAELDVPNLEWQVVQDIELQAEPRVESHIQSQAEPHVELQVEPVVEPQAALQVEPVVEAHVEAFHELQAQPEHEAHIDEAHIDEAHIDSAIEQHVAPALGLESDVDPDGVTVEAVEGLTSDEYDASLATEDASLESGFDGLMPVGIDETSFTADVELGGVSDDNIEGEALAGLIVEDFAHVADDPSALVVTGTTAGTPIHDDVLQSLTPLDVSPIPELDEAIEAGVMAAAMGDAEPAPPPRLPPFRLDPHDFILPGELPPLMVDDEHVFAGMKFALDSVNEALASQAAPDAQEDDVRSMHDDTDASSRDLPIVGASMGDDVDADADDDAESDDILDVKTPFDVEQPNDELPADVFGATSVDSPAPDAEADLAAEALLRETIEADRAVRSTPSLHIAAVAAEANAVATSRREELRAAVQRAPQDWVLRRRLAESLFEVGEREAGLVEFQAAVAGFAQDGDLTSAAEIADQLVRIAPERIAFHQKRVELAVRLSDQQRLRAAYLDLADTLVGMGDDVRAHAVYARVLEIDPWDERARTALGSAAPPPPQAAEAPADDYVSLAEWLQEDEPGTTRMRMREPQVSGDEQADFDSLLRHFKEGVARSLGEEDFESHYDLGVAYKEMGLLDDAISEFQKALRSRRHRLPAYEALGQCFVEQNRHSVAATVLARAVHEPGPTDEHRVGVLYLLAYSCEALQRMDEARSYYSRVYATDIHFRDVAARLAALDLVAR